MPDAIRDMPKMTVWQNPATGEIRILDKAATDALAETAKDARVKVGEVTATAYRPDPSYPAKVLPAFERAVMAKDASAVSFKPKSLPNNDAGSVLLFATDEVVLAGQRFRVMRMGGEVIKAPVTGEELLRMELERM